MIDPYKQTLSHSCLAACMLMLRGKKFTKIEEQDLAVRGSKRIHQFYVAGIPLEFAKKFDRDVIVYVDNKYFAKVLKEIFSQNRLLHVVQERITQSLIRNLLKRGSLICHIDDHAPDDYSHASHFIVLERETEKFVQIIDPWTGKRRKIRLTKLDEGINDLKNRIKMCPLLFSLEM